ncbi:MAG TPA: hypothetical protein VFU10_09270 [Gaiellaceae bacterium]|nr:hypothetical protein [Gaiellaceae bacterium]
MIRPLLAVAALALAAPAAAKAPATGAYGTVRRGPITPICRVGYPCDAPASNTLIQFTGNGTTTRVRTGDRGQYRVRLKPGRYAVSRTYAGPGSIRPGSIRVPATRFVHVNLFIDTGIR